MTVNSQPSQASQNGVLKQVKSDCRPMHYKVSQVHCQLTVSRFLPGSGTPLLSYSFFAVKVSPDGYGGRLCFDFPFLSKVAPKLRLSGPLLLRGTGDWVLTRFIGRESLCCKTSRDVYVLSESLFTRPLSSPHS